MTIANYGDVNTTAQVVPDVLVEKLPPSVASIAGVPTNTIGIVGSASGGPVGVPTVVGSPAQCSTIFGPLQARLYDLGTVVATATVQGANAFTIVRVTDGTDTAATATTNGVTLTSRYSGSYYNKAQIAFGVGSKSNTVKAVISIPGAVATTYDNLPSDATFWAALQTAASRDPLMVFTIGGSPTAPVIGSKKLLSGGTDGASAVNSATLVGSNVTNARTGMYALSGKGCAQVVLADATDPGQWSTQAAFGTSEGSLMVVTNSDGSISTAQANRCDSTAVKAVIGDYVLWTDPLNGPRYVSPQGFYAGRRANLAPNNSSLNKPVYGVSGTQRGSGYNSAELQTYIQAGWDVLTFGRLGASYYSMASGLNGSSDSTVNDETYSTMTNSLALSLQQGVQPFIGMPNTPDLQQKVQASVSNFLARYVTAGLLSRTAGGKMPFIVTCDATNNAQADTALGYLRVKVAVTLQGIVRFIVVDLQDGATVITNA